MFTLFGTIFLRTEVSHHDGFATFCYPSVPLFVGTSTAITPRGYLLLALSPHRRANSARSVISPTRSSRPVRWRKSTLGKEHDEVQTNLFVLDPDTVLPKKPPTSLTGWFQNVTPPQSYVRSIAHECQPQFVPTVNGQVTPDVFLATASTRSGDEK